MSYVYCVTNAIGLWLSGWAIASGHPWFGATTTVLCGLGLLIAVGMVGVTGEDLRDHAPRV